VRSVSPGPIMLGAPRGSHEQAHRSDGSRVDALYRGLRFGSVEARCSVSRSFGEAAVLLRLAMPGRELPIR
jgi:hypothetical protein